MEGSGGRGGRGTGDRGWWLDDGGFVARLRSVGRWNRHRIGSERGGALGQPQPADENSTCRERTVIWSIAIGRRVAASRYTTSAT